MCGCTEAIESVTKPPQATAPTLQNAVNQVNVVVCVGRGAQCDQCHVTLLPPLASVFSTGAECVCLRERERC